MLDIQGLVKAYDDQEVLCGVDLRIERGQIVGLLGPNGAGKTTLVSIVAGLRPADAGRVRVGGLDALATPHLVRPLLGLAPQRLGIYPTVSVRENLDLFGRIAGLRGRTLRARVDAVAEALSLTELLARRAGVLSGGQQRRLHTAMAMVHRPPLLFLDEPTVGADIDSRGQILDLVSELAGEGCAVCYATHYLPEVERLAADVAVLEAGRILTVAPVADLVDRHGVSGIRLVFRGAAPALAGFERRGDEAFLVSQTPSADLATVLATGQAWTDRLEAVEIVRSDLESAYLRLTGRDARDLAASTKESSRVP